MIGAALDQLLADAAGAGTIPWSRDPQQVRAHLAQAGLCLTCDPPDCIRRTQGSWVLLVRVRLVLPLPATRKDVDRAQDALPAVCTSLGVNTWTWDPGIQLGVDMHPGFTIDHTIGVAS